MNIKDNTTDLQMVVFSIVDQYIGIDIAAVSEIIKLDKITPVPQAPNYVEGVINIRGQVIPVINLHDMFGAQADEWNENNRVIITETGDYKFGLIVDEVYEVRKITAEMIKPAPPAVSTDQQYIEGIVLDGDNMVILVNLAKLLSTHGLSTRDMDNLGNF